MLDFGCGDLSKSHPLSRKSGNWGLNSGFSLICYFDTYSFSICPHGSCHNFFFTFSLGLPHKLRC
uniref:Uncharacterized protein n=1 Tax=Arundo donax TaxID=35708 RepID=A0A0A9ALV4_ARUDO